MEAPHGVGFIVEFNSLPNSPLAVPTIAEEAEQGKQVPALREQSSVALYPRRHQVLRTNAPDLVLVECSQGWSLGKGGGGLCVADMETGSSTPIEQKIGKTIFLRIPCSQSVGTGTHSHQLDLEAEAGRAHPPQPSLVVRAGEDRTVLEVSPEALGPSREPGPRAFPARTVLPRGLALFLVPQHPILTLGPSQKFCEPPN